MNMMHALVDKHLKQLVRNGNLMLGEGFDDDDDDNDDEPPRQACRGWEDNEEERMDYPMSEDVVLEGEEEGEGDGEESTRKRSRSLEHEDGWEFVEIANNSERSRKSKKVKDEYGNGQQQQEQQEQQTHHPLDDFIQPASIDVPLTSECYLVREKVLPFGKTIKNVLNRMVLEEVPLPLSASRNTPPHSHRPPSSATASLPPSKNKHPSEHKGDTALLLKGQTYLVRCGRINLSHDLEGSLSPKSSIGRVDLMVRAIFDSCGLYDTIPRGGKGELWMEISPRSFNIRLRAGMALSQLMIFTSSPESIRDSRFTATAAYGVCLNGSSSTIRSKQDHDCCVASSKEIDVDASHDEGETMLSMSQSTAASSDSDSPTQQQVHDIHTKKSKESKEGKEDKESTANHQNNKKKRDIVAVLEDTTMRNWLTYSREGAPLKPHIHQGSIVLSLSVPGGCNRDGERRVLGYEALPTNEVIDLTKIGKHDPARYFRALYATSNHDQQREEKSKEEVEDEDEKEKENASAHSASLSSAMSPCITLEKDRFYILATEERISVPLEVSAEMVPFSQHVGELRAHYAGYFDAGFGYGKDGSVHGTVGVLEVRPHETITVYHGQPIALMQFFWNVETPDKPYGTAGNHYHDQQGPKLAKYFKWS